MSPAKPQVVIAPHFRTMNEIFRPETRSRLEGFADVVWGRDGAMDQAGFEEALARVTAVVFGTWSYGDAIRRAGPQLQAVLEVAGGHNHRDLGYEFCLRRGIEVGSAAPAFGRACTVLALAFPLPVPRFMLAIA